MDKRRQLLQDAHRRLRQRQNSPERGFLSDQNNNLGFQTDVSILNQFITCTCNYYMYLLHVHGLITCTCYVYMDLLHVLVICTWTYYMYLLHVHGLVTCTCYVYM